MPSTYSSRLRLELPADGEQTGLWGQTTNRNLGTLLETSIAGYRTIAMLDANYTLTTSNGLDDDARYAMLNFTGTLTATRDVIAPAVSKLYVVKNQTNQTLNVKTASGIARAVPTGKTVYLFIDGLDAFDSFNDLTSLSVSGTSNLGVTNATNLAYTGTLTGGTGVVNIGSGQFTKSAAGRFVLNKSGALAVPGVAALEVYDSVFGNTISALYDSAGVGAGRGATLGLGGIFNDTGPQYTQFGAVSGLKSNVTQGDAKGALVFLVNNGSSLDEYARIIDTGFLKLSNVSGAYGGVAGVGPASASLVHIIQSNQDNTTIAAVNGNIGSAVRNFTSALATGATGLHYDALVNGTTVMRVLASGTVENATGTYGTISAAKLKENVEDAPSYLDRMMQVRFVTYNLKASTGLPTHKQFGVVAEEFEQVFPNLVYETPDFEIDEYGEKIATGTYTKGVHTSVLNLIYGKVIQEQQVLINNLAQRVQALEKKA